MYKYKHWTNTSTVQIQALYKYNYCVNANIVQVQSLYKCKQCTSTNTVKVQELYVYNQCKIASTVKLLALYKFKHCTSTSTIQIKHCKVKALYKYYHCKSTSTVQVQTLYNYRHCTVPTKISLHLNLPYRFTGSYQHSCFSPRSTVSSVPLWLTLSFPRGPRPEPLSSSKPSHSRHNNRIINASPNCVVVSASHSECLCCFKDHI
jgi:hypothetical protein